jgi:selenide,water dikinase
MSEDPIKLTQYSHGAGCGCKLAPSVLETILQKTQHPLRDRQLIVGNMSNDDAAVYDIGNGMGVISTTDFFMPIVDDPYEFGAIASSNAISDIYAMGGKPIMAIAILGWPVNTLSAEIAGKVLEGSRAICSKAGIEVAGGHSIDNPEPLFGLAVTGIAPLSRIKMNNTAKPQSLLYLTKPLGVGIITTAQKKGLAQIEHLNEAKKSMIQLNRFGELLGTLEYVNALTDVTGFGLLGHLNELCQGSKCSAELYYPIVPRFPWLDDYIENKCIPGGTKRNYDSYGQHIVGMTDEQRNILCDPQTSGGLLISIDPDTRNSFETLAAQNELNLQPIGRVLDAEKKPVIYIKSTIDA